MKQKQDLLALPAPAVTEGYDSLPVHNPQPWQDSPGLHSTYSSSVQWTMESALDSRPDGSADPHLKLLYPPLRLPTPVDESLPLSCDLSPLVVVLPTLTALPFPEAYSDSEGFLAEEPPLSPVSQHSVTPGCTHLFRCTTCRACLGGTHIFGAHSTGSRAPGPAWTLIDGCTHHQWPHISPPHPLHWHLCLVAWCSV